MSQVITEAIHPAFSKNMQHSQSVALNVAVIPSFLGSVFAYQHNVELVFGFCRQQALCSSVIQKEAMNLDEQPAIGLSDFEAALAVYRPTQLKD